MNQDDLNISDLAKILNRLDLLEGRVKLLESAKEQIKTAPILFAHDAGEDEEEFVNVSISPDSLFESKLGEYGLAWLGNIVLFFAIAFLWQYFNDAGKPLISMMVGLISVGSVFILSHYFQDRFTYLSFIFNFFGFIILYYVILRLHYYTDKPFLTNQVFATFLLLIVVGIQLYFAFKKQSQVFAGLAFTLTMITAFVCDQTQVFFMISVATTCLVLYSFWNFNWWKSMIFILCLSYFIYLFWLLKNHQSMVKTTNDLTYQFAFIYISITTAIYSLVTFKKSNDLYPENLILATILLAGISYSVLMLLLVFKYFPNSFVSFFTIISVYCIFYSAILKFYSPWKYTPALFALFGFMAISVTICGIYHFPDSFLLLIGQSFLVLVLALWYRSHIITLINTFLLVFLVITYYNISGTLHSVNFTIPVVAFLSARIINWQKERLNIKTDFIRNIYLFTLFFSLLYATYKGLPGEYITFSWLLIAAIYLGLSIIVKSIKYRWMAMANLMVTAFYLFIFDLANTELIFRILAFLVFAVVSIGISTYYVRKLKKND